MIRLMSQLITVISKNIKKARLSKNLTQLEVASKADISVNHYAKIERGEVQPTILTLEGILKAIGASSRDILPF